MRPLVFFVLILFVGCGASPEKDTKLLTEDSIESTPIEMQRHVIGFRRISIFDSLSGHNAISCLIPQNWQLTTSTEWVHSDYVQPFKYALVAVDSDSFNRIELYPTLSFFTSSERSTTLEPSANKLELTHAVMLANTAVDAIRDYLIPTFRADLHDLRVKEFIPLSSLEDVDENGKPISKETGMMRIQYTMNHQPVEEIFFATLSKTFIPIDKYNTQCRWHIENAVSCRAHAGYLDEQLQNTLTTIGSLRYGYTWLLKYDDVLKQLLQQKQNISNAKLKQLVAGAATDPSKASDIFQTHQRRLLRFAQAYIRYEPKLQTYVDNTGEYIQLPKGYSVAWKSEENDYVLSDSSGFKPDDAEMAWYELQPHQSTSEQFPMISANVVFD